jgi:hypothetical protein
MKESVGVRVLKIEESESEVLRTDTTALFSTTNVQYASQHISWSQYIFLKLPVMTSASK